ncbi:MAG TPA: hypothetical protein P5572_08995 [Phycisphaerae bacterium]|nr:hypothetical protein [Phycisphaerae bacterium]
MSRTQDHFRLGLTVILMFALFVACLLFIGGKGLLQKEMRPLTVRLEAGPAMPEISAGSLVTCFGQPVGKVVTTDFVFDTDPHAPQGPKTQFLEVHAEAAAELDLRADCVIVVAGPPLGGKGYLEIVNRGVSAKPLAPDARIEAGTTGLQAALAQLTAEFDAQNPSSLLAQIKRQLEPDAEDSIIYKVNVSLANISRLTASLAREVDRKQDGVLLAKVHTALDKVNAGLGEILEMVQDTRPQVDTIMESAGHAMQRVDEGIVGPLAEELDRTQDSSLLAEVHEAMGQLNSSLAHVETITSEGERTVVLNSARIDELVQNATEASILLKRGVKDLALQPWRLMNKPSAREQRELSNMDVAREFSDAAARLDDAAVRLKALADAEGTALAADDPKLQQIRKDLAESIDDYNKAEAALWKRLGIH